MHPHTHLIPFKDQGILYLNGSMKCILLTADEMHSFTEELDIPVLSDLLRENERIYCQQNELRLGEVGLTLNVANTCNLRCSYCYANGGNYHGEDALMSADLASSAVRIFAKQYGNLKRIKFFGGEPFLNPEAIRAACETCATLVREGMLRDMPDFTTVTNGSILTQKLIDLINQYDIGVTVSYDGDPAMQDKLRPYVSGWGSNDSVLENVQRLQAATGGKQPSSVEVTYTQVHVEQGVSVRQCYDNVIRLLRISDVKITPVSCSDEDVHFLRTIESFQQAIQSGYKQNPINRRVVEKAYRLYQVLTHRKRSDHIFCGAGINRFSVSADGRVYPCYLFTNDDVFCLGNLLDGSCSLADYEPERQKLMEYDRLSANECGDCWASSFCFGCRGNNRRLSGNPDIPSADFCRMLKEITENLLCCMADAGDIEELDHAVLD